MELRRIIKFGTSSFVVSLPKNWVDKNELSKGDLLYFNENGNNELVISPRDTDKKKKLSRVTINVSNKPLSTIRREIMAAYIGNHDIIKITGDLSKVRPDIDNILHGLLALEIMEDMPERIVAKDFLNISDISLNDVIRRIDIMVRVMMNDVETSFSKNMYEKVNQLDKSVNKLMFLVFRVIRKGLKDPGVLKSLNVNNCAELLDYWILTDKLEGIADDTKRITRHLKKTSLIKHESDELKKLFLESKNAYINTIKAFYSGDTDVAHQTASGINDRLKQWEEVALKSENKVVGSMIERFKAIDGQLRNIARMVVDRGVKGEQEK